MKKNISKFLGWIIKDMLATIRHLVSMLILFYLLVRGYKHILGINYSIFSSQQLQSTIVNGIGQNSFGENISNYKLYKIDFYGLGEKSYVAVFDDNVADSVTTKFIVFDKTFLNPVETLLFGGDLYKRSFEFQLDGLGMYADTDIYIKSYNGKDSLIFSWDNLAGIIQYDGKYNVIPLFSGGRNVKRRKIPTTIPPGELRGTTGANGEYIIPIKTSNSDIYLSKVPIYTQTFFDEEKKIMYLASPIMDDKEMTFLTDENYQNFDLKEQRKYYICGFMETAESYILDMIGEYNNSENCYISSYKYPIPAVLGKGEGKLGYNIFSQELSLKGLQPILFINR